MTTHTAHTANANASTASLETATHVIQNRHHHHHQGWLHHHRQTVPVNKTQLFFHYYHCSFFSFFFFSWYMCNVRWQRILPTRKVQMQAWVHWRRIHVRSRTTTATSSRRWGTHRFVFFCFFVFIYFYFFQVLRMNSKTQKINVGNDIDYKITLKWLIHLTYLLRILFLDIDFFASSFPSIDQIETWRDFIIKIRLF